MAAHRGLGEEKVVSRLGEAFQTGYTAKSFQMSKINLGWFFFHIGQNIKLPFFLNASKELIV